MLPKILITALALTTAADIYASDTTPQSDYDKWELVWSDDFNGPKLDTNVWSRTTRGAADWQNTQSDDERCLELRNGLLVLKGIVNDNLEADTARFLTGGIWSLGKKQFEPGRIEVRARLHGAKGAWPAIWMMPFDTEKKHWPLGGEIDMMERLNNDTIAYQTVHSNYTHNLGLNKNPRNGATGAIDRDGFNTYGVDMYPDSLVFHINGVKTFTYPKISTDKPGQFPFYQPQYMLIDMQLGGNWVGKVDPADLPVEMEVDWVRQYRLKPTDQSPATSDGYTMVWHDEFDIDGKPAPHWNYEKGFVRNKELQWYQPQNATVENGCLVITGKREEVTNDSYDPSSRDWRRNRPKASYTSSCLTTSDSFNFMYGRLEVRARIPVTSGAWPAIWTLGNKWGWPANGELDLMEYYRRDQPIILANACWRGADGSSEWDESTTPLTSFTDTDSEWASKFHIWRMDWTPETIKMYLDDRLLNEIPLSQADKGGGRHNDVNPFANDVKGFGHYILLNLAIGGNGGIPDDASFPLRYEIDYVRVYEKQP